MNAGYPPRGRTNRSPRPCAGFRERSTANPLSCCLNDPFLVGAPNPINDFDHQVGHVLTNKRKIKFVKGYVDGRARVNGLYPSDHAGLTSLLKIR